MRIRSTTIIAVKKDGHIAMAGDGQVTMGDDGDEEQRPQGAQDTRRLGARRASPAPRPTPLPCSSTSRSSSRNIRATLTRSAVELAKDWRTDKHAAQARSAPARGGQGTHILLLSGTGDVIEPAEDVIAIGSGGQYALCGGPGLPGQRRASCRARASCQRLI
jgi:ATP-dependent HslUV protease, peptidase subunit HslV